MIINFIKKIFNEKYIKIKGINNISKKNKIKVKFGIDPTNCNLHLGHFLFLKKIKKLSKNKKIKIFIIIGGYTGLLGDISKIKKRKIINKKKIIYNSIKIEKFLRNYFSTSVFILNNLNWFSYLNFYKLKDISLNRLILRKEIKNKIKKKKKIKIGELLYPFFQNYDNYITKCDVEIGGKDQEFNMFYDRKIKKCNIIFDLLPDIKGLKKMSSSKKNKCIFINDNSNIIFWKVLNIRDENIKNFFYFFNNIKKVELKYIKKNKINIVLKKKLVLFVLIANFLKKGNKKSIITDFLKKKKKKKIIIFNYIIPAKIIDIISKIFNKSKLFFKRLIKNKSILINNVILNNFYQKINENKFVIKIGKKEYKIIINSV
ncbi:tyrosine--tRNA ligase [Candidatus Vidania fulgoroideorum]